eukprot:346473-Prorocentrum_minimum.AAC.1
MGVYSHGGPIRHSKRGYIFTTDQSAARGAGRVEVQKADLDAMGDAQVVDLLLHLPDLVALGVQPLLELLDALRLLGVVGLREGPQQRCAGRPTLRMELNERVVRLAFRRRDGAMSRDLLCSLLLHKECRTSEAISAACISTFSRSECTYFSCSAASSFLRDATWRSCRPSSTAVISSRSDCILWTD